MRFAHALMIAFLLLFVQRSIAQLDTDPGTELFARLITDLSYAEAVETIRSVANSPSVDATALARIIQSGSVGMEYRRDFLLLSLLQGYQIADITPPASLVRYLAAGSTGYEDSALRRAILLSMAEKPGIVPLDSVLRHGRFLLDRFEETPGRDERGLLGEATAYLILCEELTRSVPGEFPDPELARILTGLAEGSRDSGFVARARGAAKAALSP